jgi:hypothetical protein
VKIKLKIYVKNQIGVHGYITVDDKRIKREYDFLDELLRLVSNCGRGSLPPIGVETHGSFVKLDNGSFVHMDMIGVVKVEERED